MTDKFEQLESYYDDLSPNGKWLIDEVRRLRAEHEITASAFQRTVQRLHGAWSKLAGVGNTTSPDLLDMIDSVVGELTELRQDVVAPLSDRDKLGTIIENVSEKVYDKQARTDIVWLTQEIGRLRALVKWVNHQLSSHIWIPDIDRENTREAVKKATHHLKGRATELAEIHDTLAEALGYEKAPSAEEDPHCPCPGDYITGEHTPVTLAAEAAQKIKKLTKEIEECRMIILIAGVTDD